jgi:hypothetical protein
MNPVRSRRRGSVFCREHLDRLPRRRTPTQHSFMARGIERSIRKHSYLITCV